MTESEVPSNLQHAIAAAKSDSSVAAIDLHPPSEWHDCPDCGKRLHGQSVIHDGKSELIAVEYSCKCLFLWTWEPNTDELYYRGESELVDEFSDSQTVIDFYRARWTIEDWHKVLKTGCRIEERRLETWERMEVLLSVYSVIAWKVLTLRELARGTSHHSPDVLLTDDGAKAYAIAVAKIGGYLNRGSDPPPGWETMWKGLKKLRT